MRKSGLTALVAVMVMAVANTASASLYISGTTAGFTAATMDGFTVIESSPVGTYEVNNLSGGDDIADTVTLNPSYSDTQTPMSGAAGATGRWTGIAAGTDVEVLLGNTFTATDLSGLGITELGMVAFNDNNNDNWNHGLWIEIDGVKTKSGAVDIVAGGSAFLSLDLTGLDLTKVTGYGVFVGNDSVPGGDAFHSSWSIPEPASVICWSVMASVGGLGLVRNRRRAKQA